MFINLGSDGYCILYPSGLKRVCQAKELRIKKKVKRQALPVLNAVQFAVHKNENTVSISGSRV